MHPSQEKLAVDTGLHGHRHHRRCSMIIPFESVVGPLHFCYFLCRPHLRVLLYAGELLKRPNTKLQMDSDGVDTEKL